MKKSCFALLVVAVALFAVVGPAAAMDADELINKHLEATGGKEKLQSIQSNKVTGKFMTQGMEFPFTMTQKRPNLLRIDAEVMGMSMIQAFDGEAGWSINPMTGSPDPQPMGDLENKSFKLQADMDGALMNYADKGFTVEYLGEEDVEGTPCHKLRLDTKLDIVIEYFFDAEYFLIIKQASTITMDENVIESQTYMSDFQEINGVVMPFAIETRMGDMVANNMVFEDVEQDVEVDDSIFVMPEKAALEAPDKPTEPEIKDNK